MNLRVIAVATALTIALAGSAFAQAPAKQKGQKRDKGARGVQLANMPVQALDRLVTLTADQKTKITAIQDKFEADAKALPKDPSSREKRRDLNRAATQQVMAVLTDAQKEKLRSAMKELGPIAGAGIPIPLLQDLKLTDEQKKKIADIVAEARKGAASGPGDRKAMREQVQTKIAAVLTAEQKAIVTKYMAEHGKGRKKKKA